MTVKVTAANGGSDSVDFINASGTTLAQVKGYDDGSSNGHLELYTTASGTSTERVRVDSSGNVGIGTSSPSGNLDVVGSTASAVQQLIKNSNGATNSSAELTFGTWSGSSASAPQAKVAAINVNSGNAATDLAFSTYTGASLAERMRIDSSGRLLVGTTSSTNGGNMFVYNPGASAWSTAVVNSKTDNSTVTNGFLVKYTGVSPSDGNYMFLCQDSNGTNRFYVTNAGGTGGTSDENLKKNIETTRDGYLEDLNKIRIVKYNWKEQPDGTPKDLGWIAQEVEQVFPRMVKTDEDTGIKSVTHSAFVPMLIKAIQEQSTLISSQAAAITALTERINALEAK